MSTWGQNRIPDLRDHVLTCVLPFWERYGIDRDYGGFITHLARDGTITDSSAKFLVGQTRMIYSFAAGAELGGPPEWLKMADQGVDFLLRRFRDCEYDGWFWSTSREGRPMRTEKRACGHACATYALAEYGRIAGDTGALAAATHTWSLMSNYLWDAENDGLIESCGRAWEPTDKSHTMVAHLHALEAVLALNEAVGGNRFWPRVRAICDLLVTPMVDSQHRCGLGDFYPDWRCKSERSRTLVSYGHNLKAAWLLLRVHRREDAPAYRDTARQFLDYSLRCGLDATHGGVFSHGPLGGEATVREKIWWVQCEGTKAFLLGYLEFGDRRYWEAFRSVARFCQCYLHDAEHGEWYASTEEDGTPRQMAKGSEWKAAYHVMQACRYAHRYLAEIQAGE